MKIGYARVSTTEQNLDRQILSLENAGVEEIFSEKITGKIVKRPQLDKLLEILRKGDIVIIHDLTRLSRKLRDVLFLVDLIHGKGADIRSLKEDWLDTTTPSGKLIFHIFAALAQFEREQISERTKEGLQAARIKGHYGGRPPVKEEKVAMAIRMYHDNYVIKEIIEATGLSRATIYNYIKKGRENE